MRTGVFEALGRELAEEDLDRWFRRVGAQLGAEEGVGGSMARAGVGTGLVWEGNSFVVSASTRLAGGALEDGAGRFFGGVRGRSSFALLFGAHVKSRV